MANFDINNSNLSEEDKKRIIEALEKSVTYGGDIRKPSLSGTIRDSLYFAANKIKDIFD